jgi:hypothetical protein
MVQNQERLLVASPLLKVSVELRTYTFLDVFH